MYALTATPQPSTQSISAALRASALTITEKAQHDLTSSYDSLIIAESMGVCSGGTTVLTV